MSAGGTPASARPQTISTNSSVLGESSAARSPGWRLETVCDAVCDPVDSFDECLVGEFASALAEGDLVGSRPIEVRIPSEMVIGM